MKHSHTFPTTSQAGVNASVSPGLGEAPGDIAAADVEQWIRTQAYLRSEQRGFVPGGLLNDWLEAEQDWFLKSKV